MIVARLPLRTLIPLLIVAVLAIGAGAWFFVNLNLARDQLTTKLEEKLDIVGTMTASRLETALRAGNASQARRALEQVFVDPNSRAAMVFDGSDTVLLADSYPSLGLPLTRTVFVDGAPLFGRVRASGMRALALGEDRSRLFAVYPLTLPPAPGQVIGDRSGLLALMADATSIGRQALDRAVAGFAATMTVGIAVTFVLWALLNRHLLGRVRRLQAATDAIADGTYDTRMQLDGHDELAAIGANLERMRAHLAEQSERLRSSEERYRSFVQTSSDGIFLLECQPPVPVAWPVTRQIEAILDSATLRTCNRIFAELRGADSPDALLGATAARALGGGSRDAVAAVLGDWINNDYKLGDIVARPIDAQSRRRLLRCSLVGIVREGMLTGIWGADSDETERASLEERNRAILAGSRDGFLLLDLDGNVLEVNDAYCAMIGYDNDTLTALRYSDLVARGETDRVPGGEMLRDRGSALFETAHLAADGRRVELELSAIYLDHRGGRIVTFVRDVSERNAARRQLERYANRLRDMSHRLLRLQESERRHIARELHDEIGQQLTALSINLQIAAAAASGQDGALLRDCMQIATGVMDQVRDMSLSLRPSMLDDLGLPSAIRWLARKQARRGGMDLVLELDGELPRYPADIETTAYRLVQEALTNALKHSGASRVTVVLRASAEQLYVEVSDDGTGFSIGDDTHDKPGDSLGLDGLHERLGICGGRMEIASSPGNGTTIRAWLPIDTDLVIDETVAQRIDDRS